jgi:hypothetical protein
MIAVVAIGIAVPALAQNSDARDGSTSTTPAPLPTYPMADILDEDFDDIFILEFEGWCFQNNSFPLGTTSWLQGSGVFPSHAGCPNCMIAGNYQASGSPGDISLWLITPEYDLGMVATWSLWTRTVDGTSWPDRAQIRYSTAGSSCNVGTGVEDVGDFTNLLEDINPNEILDPPDQSYPQAWTEYSYDMSGVTGNGRLAFRYYIHDSGPTGANSNYVGVDTWQLDSGGGDGGADDGGADDGGDVPATTTWGVIVLIALFLGITLFYLRRRARA